MKAIRLHAANWMRADAVSAPYDGRDVITESVRLALWRLGYGHLDPTGRPEPVHVHKPVDDEVPDPAFAARLGDMVRRSREEAAAITLADPIGATVLCAKAAMISESLVAAGYDETGQLPGRG